MLIRFGTFFKPYILKPNPTLLKPKSVTKKSPCGQVDSLLDTRLLRPRQKSFIVDTDIPFYEAKLFTEEEGRRVNTFY
jgi:hypothetical protein